MAEIVSRRDFSPAGFRWLGLKQILVGQLHLRRWQWQRDHAFGVCCSPARNMHICTDSQMTRFIVVQWRDPKGKLRKWESAEHPGSMRRGWRCDHCTCHWQRGSTAHHLGVTISTTAGQRVHRGAHAPATADQAVLSYYLSLGC